MAGHNRPKGTAGMRCAGVGKGVVIATTRAPAAGAVLTADRGFLGKNPSFSLGFPGRGLGFRKTKNPLPGGSGLRMRSLGAPQFFHFPCAAAARFVVVTWLICQEATACRRTEARRQPMVWEAGAEMVCIVQFMEGVIAGSVPIVCGRRYSSEQARFSSRGCTKILSAAQIRPCADPVRSPCRPKARRPQVPARQWNAAVLRPLPASLSHRRARAAMPPRPVCARTSQRRKFVSSRRQRAQHAAAP